MNNLTVGDLREALKHYPSDLPVFLGDDEELNGIHRAYYAQKFTAKEAEESSYGSISEAGFLIS